MPSEKEKSQELYEKAPANPNGFTDSPSASVTPPAPAPADEPTSTPPPSPKVKVNLYMKDSKNPLALASDSMYSFRFDDKITHNVLVTTGLTTSSIELEPGNHYFTVKAYGYSDHEMKNDPIYTSDTFHFTATLGRETSITLNRPSLFSAFKAEIS